MLIQNINAGVRTPTANNPIFFFYQNTYLDGVLPLFLQIIMIKSHSYIFKSYILHRTAALLIVLCFTLALFAQQSGSPIINNTPTPIENTPVSDTVPTAIKNFLLLQQVLQKHPYFNFKDIGIAPQYVAKKQEQGKEIYFYLLAAVLLLFAIFRTVFAKYFTDLMSLFFKQSPKHRQLKQQVSQNSLPSLFFNLLYTIVMAVYLAIVLNDLGNTSYSFFTILAYAFIGILALYIGKFIILKITGWVFDLNQVTDSYIFLVFLINKIIGIVLLPVILIAGLANIELKTIVLTISWVMLAGLYIYRFIQAIGIIQGKKTVSTFHFLLYLSAFEILPVMVIYKTARHYL